MSRHRVKDKLLLPWKTGHNLVRPIFQVSSISAITIYHPWKIGLFLFRLIFRSHHTTLSFTCISPSYFNMLESTSTSAAVGSSSSITKWFTLRNLLLQQVDIIQDQTILISTSLNVINKEQLFVHGGYSLFDEYLDDNKPITQLLNSSFCKSSTRKHVRAQKGFEV